MGTCTALYCSHNVQVPLVILGDPAYPALPWVMKPYPENAHTTPDQKIFNYRQSRARMVVENAFGRLKGRWRCMLKRLDMKLRNVPDIVAACVCLHNICEMFGDECRREWIQQPPSDQDCSTQVTRTTSSRSDESQIRNAIMQYLSE